MTKAVTLAELADQNVLTATDNKVGIATTNPQSTLQVGTGITMNGNTGVITAQAYYGDGSNLTGVDSTALKDSNADIRVQATTTGATITGDLTVDNISVGGTITYDDVTNVDSIGIVTARSGIDVTDGVVKVGTAITMDSVSGVITATKFSGDGSGLIGVASTDNIITGTAATFNNVVKVGTGITMDSTSGIITATAFHGDGSNLTFAPKIIAFDPAALSTGVAADTNITITFDQDIEFYGTGTIELRSTSASGTVIEDFNINGPTPPSGLSISGTQLIINPTNNLSDDTVVYVILPVQGIRATSGQAYYAGSSNYNFRTVAQSFTAQGGTEYTIANQAGDPSPSPTGFYKYHIFTNPGILTTSAPSSSANSLQLLSIAGGGGGGNHYPTQSPMHPAQGGGGGGAGGYVTHTGPTLNLASGTYSVSIGTGGLGGDNATPGTREGYPGTDTTITPPASPTTYLLRAYGGGGGGGAMSPAQTGYENYGNSIGQPGGSGGGGATSFNVDNNGIIGGNQVPGQGYAGSNSIPVRQADPPSISEDGRTAGGGGGAGGQGSDTSVPQRFWNPGSGSYPFALGGTGGPGATNGAFAAPHLSLSGLPADKLSAIGPTGLYGAGGGGGAVGGPIAVGGAGGAGGGGHGQGNTSLPQSASDARPAIIINNMAPGPYPSYPTNMTFSDATGVGCGGGGAGGGSGEYGGDGTDGILMIRYAVPGS